MAVQDITNKGATALGLYSTTSDLVVIGPIGGVAKIDPDMTSQQVIDILFYADEIYIATDSTPVVGTLPILSGNFVVGQIVSATDGSVSGNPPATVTARQWYMGGNLSGPWVEISGATFATFSPTDGDSNRYLQYRVTYTNAVGSITLSSATSPLVTSVPIKTMDPVVSGTAAVGQVLTTTNGAWRSGLVTTYAYQWRRGAAEIAGATAQTYTLVTADAGQQISCRVTATNSLGAGVPAITVATAAVTMPPTNTALPMVSGSAQVGQTMTSTTGVWSGSPTPAYTRQWQASPNGTTGWTNIAGATAGTYIPTSDVVGSFLRCVVTATNSSGSATASGVGANPVIV